MNVACSPRIEPWNNGFETVSPRLISELMAAQPIAIVIVFAPIIGLPEVQERLRDRLAAPRQHGPCEDDRSAREARFKE
jgi:hypothetical protein